MNCEELRPTLSAYLDDALSAGERAGADEHLQACPVCRAELSGLRIVVRGLQSVRPAPIPASLGVEITDALYVEAMARRRQRVSPSISISRWLQPRLMPYSVATLASFILFFTMFAGLRSSLRGFHNWDQVNRTTASTYRISSGGYDLNQPITAEFLASRRADFASESPSLNPSGALAALTMIPARNEGDDDMVVVADVFSNGIASLAGVVQAPRDRRMLDEFQDALRKDAAFVPASYDRRPQTIRVVLVVTKVAVSDHDN
jgi:hypothetical protein